MKNIDLRGFAIAHNAPPDWRPVRPEINMAKIPADANVGGLIFAIATIVVFLVGIPEIRLPFTVALIAGVAIALILHFLRHAPRGLTVLHF